MLMSPENEETVVHSCNLAVRMHHEASGNTTEIDWVSE